MQRQRDDRWRADCSGLRPVNYVRLPPCRDERPHVALVTVLLACAFSVCVVEMARSCRRTVVREYASRASHAP